MKTLLLIILTISSTILSSQINGNGELITRNIPLPNIKNIVIEWSANITIDCQKNGIEVTAESNIIEYINFDITGDSLTIDQKKWIEASKNVTIVIGAQNLESVNLGSHAEIDVINIDSKKIFLEAELGTINVSGKTDFANLKSYSGKINAKQLIAKKAIINILEDGKVVANVTQEASCKINEDGIMKFANKPKICNNCSQQNFPITHSTKWISLKIKNNTWGRKHFEVVGPKPKGGKFSYGFPMMPGQIKKERWTVGTKIYKKNKLGARTLLVTLSGKDEGKIVKLF